MKNWLLLLVGLTSVAEAAQLKCNESVTPIAEIQGMGKQSPLLNQQITTKGVVTADFRGKDALEGFFIQQLDADNNPATSDGMFIHYDDRQQILQPGDVVMVQGKVSEQFEVTQINDVSVLKVCHKEQILPEPVLLTLPLKDYDLEQVEGMRVRFKQPVVITDIFQYPKYGEITVSSDLLLNPTARFRPGPQVKEQYKLDKQNRLIIDDGSLAEYPVATLFNQPPITLGQKLNVTGVMHFAFGQYKIQPSEKFELMTAFTKSQPQTPSGKLKVANFNLKNFFTSIDVGQQCGPRKNFSCRGADSQAEYDRQVLKLATAINLADADIMAVEELENTEDTAQQLVSSLNQLAGKQKWSFIQTGALGDDVIRVGILYQPGRVKALGKYALLNQGVNAAFDETKHRIVVTQTFVTQNNNKVNFAAAHLKSKSCQDATDKNLDQKDGQGCFNVARTEAAHLVANWLLADPTGQDAPYTILAGDLNAYQKEDPVVILQNQGLKNLAEQFLGPHNWTASYRGYVGSLDYILANDQTAKKATGLTQWHINSIYSAWFDYNLEPISEDNPKPAHYYQPSPFASSDHDMVIAGFDL
ncbi:MAG: ExeM/NucH family extracellular endonuclease [Marinicella sp.]|nr:ExeM/NucH family extracellular endonuclease [Xanthomonadales bacterium]